MFFSPSKAEASMWELLPNVSYALNLLFLFVIGAMTCLLVKYRRDIRNSGLDFLTKLPLRKTSLAVAEMLFKRTYALRFNVVEAERKSLARVFDGRNRRRADAPDLRKKMVTGIMDVDHFKRVNDELGHDIGDEVLKILGRLMRDQSRGSDLDIVGRWGGEEFVFFLTADTGGASSYYNRVREAFFRETTEFYAKNGIKREGEKLSCGVVELLNRNDTIETLIKMADQALYQAKNSGRDRMVIYDRPDEFAEPVAAKAV